MPSFYSEFTSQTPLDHRPQLLLLTQHIFYLRSSSLQTYRVTSRIPKEIDIVLASDLVINLTGILDDAPVPGGDMVKSGVARHLRDYLELNASQLNIDSVSEVHGDQRGLPTLILKMRHDTFIVPKMPYFTLALIKMTYAFQTLPLSENNTVSCDDPIFSPRLALPVATTLDIVVSQFVTSQLVKQYPLLFGPFKHINAEMAYVTPIIDSCLNIVEYAQGETSRQKCKNYIETLRQEHASSLSSASRSLHLFLADINNDLAEDAQAPTAASMSDEEIIQFNLQAHLRSLMRSKPFKPLVYRTLGDANEDGFDFAQHFPSESVHGEESPSDDIFTSSKLDFTTLEAYDNSWFGNNDLFWSEDEQEGPPSISPSLQELDGGSQSPLLGALDRSSQALAPPVHQLSRAGNAFSDPRVQKESDQNTSSANVLDYEMSYTLLEHSVSIGLDSDEDLSGRSFSFDSDLDDNGHADKQIIAIDLDLDEDDAENKSNVMGFRIRSNFGSPKMEEGDEGCMTDVHSDNISIVMVSKDFTPSSGVDLTLIDLDDVE